MKEKILALHEKAAAYALQGDVWIRRSWRENEPFLMQLGMRKLRIARDYSDQASTLEAKYGSVFPGVPS